MDIASLASQHGKDGSQTPLSGLQTPPSAFERRRNSMHQLVRATSQPSLADSPSPLSSIYLQRQSSTLPPHPDTALCTNPDQQRINSRTQRQAISPTLEGDGTPWRSSSDGLHHPATSSWQHQLYNTPVPSHPHPSFLSSSQRQWSSNLVPEQKSDQYTQHQQLHHPAAEPVIHQEAKGHGTALDSPLQQPKLVSEPPSASWSQAVPRENGLDMQMAASLSSLAIAGPRGPSRNGSCSCLQSLLLTHLRSEISWLVVSVKQQYHTVLHTADLTLHITHIGVTVRAYPYITLAGGTC